jgi:toxin ParE1/3/4
VNAEVRWTEQAVADLQAIREFITRDSPRYGRLVAERLFTATEPLETFPLSGRIVPELGRDDVREIIVGEYRLVYRVSSGAVIMLTIFRSSRLFPGRIDQL